MQANTLFIVTSAIYVTSTPLSYTSRRSAFSPDERAHQTLQSIQSIRAAVPNARILLIELGLVANLPYNIAGQVDTYLYVGGGPQIREAVDSPYKGWGEAIGLYLSDEPIRAFHADYYVKMSGRYFLDHRFNTNVFDANAYTGRLWVEGGHEGLFTVLYGFPNRLYGNWRYALAASIPALHQGQSLETAMTPSLEKPIHYISELGVSGWTGSDTSVFVSL